MDDKLRCCLPMNIIPALTFSIWKTLLLDFLHSVLYLEYWFTRVFVSEQEDICID